MNNYIEYLKNNPQIIAACITALCSTIGIFINIGINIYFRKQDYKIKSKIKYIDTLEQYYAILIDKLIRFSKIIDRFENIENLCEIFTNCNDAKYDNDKKQFTDALKEIAIFVDKCEQKYAGDFNLYIYQKYVIDSVLVMFNDYTQQKNIGNTKINKIDFKNNIDKLIKRFEYIKIVYFSTNMISFLYNIFVLWNIKRK